jgi:hypothetical protein
MCVHFPPSEQITASSDIAPSYGAGNAWRSQTKTNGQAHIGGLWSPALVRLSDVLPFPFWLRDTHKGFTMTVMHGLQTNTLPSSLIFTLCGSPSPPLALTAEDQIPDHSALKICQASTVILSDLISQGRFRIFRGHFQGRPVVAKFTAGSLDRSKSHLQAEYSVYRTLQHLQGSAIPRCYGLFHVEGACLLLMEDCGRSLETLDDLSSNQRSESVLDS